MAQSSSNWFVRARLKTRQLMLLAAMEEEGNVRRAADVLGMTQPAASRLLKELEDVLDGAAFRPHALRDARYAVREVMIRHARMVLSNQSQAHDEISALRAGLVGQVQIGRHCRSHRNHGAACHRAREGAYIRNCRYGCRLRLQT